MNETQPPTTDAACPPLSKRPDGRIFRQRPDTQILELQRLAVADAFKPDTKPSVRAALMRSFCLLDARLSAHRMKPLPKSVDVTKYHAARAAARKQGKEKHAQPSEPTPASAQPPKESLSPTDRGSGGAGEGGEATAADDETPT